MRRPLVAALVAAAGLTACTSSGTPASARPSISHRFMDATAMTIAQHIPGCTNPVSRRAANDLDRMFRSLAQCDVASSHVIIDAQAKPNVATSEMSSPHVYVIGGYGWTVMVHGSQSTADAVAKALGGTATR